MSDIFEINFQTNAAETTAKLDRLENETKALAATMKGTAPAVGKTEKAVRGLGNAAQVSGKKMNRMTVGMQQAGYQVGDFAVQVQGGTNWMLALGQQGTQLLGIFGAGGAIAGAALAITTAIVRPLMEATSVAGDTGEAMDTLIAQVTSFNDLTLKDIIGQYGELTEEISSALITQSKLNLSMTSARLSEAISKKGGVSEGIQTLGFGASRGGDLSTQGFKGDAADLVELNNLQSRLEFAKGEDRFAAARDLYTKLESTVSTDNSLDNPLLGGLRDLNEVVLQINEFEKASEDLVNSITEVRAGRGPGGTGDKPGSKKDPLDAMWKRFSRDAASAVKSANKEIDRNIDRKIKQDDRIRLSLEKSMLTQEEKIMLNIKEADRVGATNETLTRLNEKLGEAQVKANFFATTLGNELNNAFGSVISGASSTKDAMLNMINSILQATAQNVFKTGVTDILTKALTGVAGGAAESIANSSYLNPGQVESSPTPISKPIRNALGGAYGINGRITAYAKGGVVGGPTMFGHAGGLGLMGEAGPEAIMPLKRGANGSLGVTAAAPSPVVVNIKNESGGEVETSQGPNGLDIIIGAVSRDIAAGGKTFNTIRKTFNITPGIQRRA